jgi:2-aminomuconate deaminase
MRNEAIILSNRAQALANYPHARRVGDVIYVSGISSRKFDGTWEGVVERDGGYDLDISVQTRAVIEKYLTSL